MTFQNDQMKIKNAGKNGFHFQLKKVIFLFFSSFNRNDNESLFESHVMLHRLVHSTSRFISLCMFHFHKSIIIHLPYFFCALSLAHIRLLIYLIVARMFSLLVILISFSFLLVSLSLYGVDSLLIFFLLFCRVCFYILAT